MLRELAWVVMAICFGEATGFAATPAELLQKGIFAQETEGNLDRAASIYRQILASNPAQKDVAAEAQYRLSQIQLQKGDFRGAPPIIAALAALSFDPAAPVTVRGSLVRVLQNNPLGMIVVDAEDRSARYVFATASARMPLAPGSQVTVTGLLAQGEQKLERMTPARANTISDAQGHKVFDRNDVPVRPVDDSLRQRLSETLKVIQALEAKLNMARAFGDDDPSAKFLADQLASAKQRRDSLLNEIAGTR